MNKKVIIWGTGATYRVLRDKIHYYFNNNSVEIVAFVNKSGEGVIDGYSVISKDMIGDYIFDHLLICADGEMAISIFSEVKNMTIPENKICRIDDFLFSIEEYKSDNNKIIDIQCKIIQDILNASDSQVSDFNWIRNKIREFGVYPFEITEDKNILWTQWGIMQIVDEFAQFCQSISLLKIKSAIEVGVFKGRSAYFVCALLSRSNPELKYHCVDIFDNMDSFEKYNELLPALIKCIPSQSSDYINEVFDYVFIDADHSYNGSIADYYNVGKKAKVIVAFHDVYGHEYDYLDGGTVRTWKEAIEDNKDKEYKVFSCYPDKWMGIGAIMM